MLDRSEVLDVLDVSYKGSAARPDLLPSKAPKHDEEAPGPDPVERSSGAP